MRVQDQGSAFFGRLGRRPLRIRLWLQVVSKPDSCAWMMMWCPTKILICVRGDLIEPSRLLGGPRAFYRKIPTIQFRFRASNSRLCRAEASWDPRKVFRTPRVVECSRRGLRPPLPAVNLFTKYFSSLRHITWSLKRRQTSPNSAKLCPHLNIDLQFILHRSGTLPFYCLENNLGF